MQPGRTCIDHINYYVARKKRSHLKEMSVKSSFLFISSLCSIHRVVFKHGQLFNHEMFPKEKFTNLFKTYEKEKIIR